MNAPLLGSRSLAMPARPLVRLAALCTLGLGALVFAYTPLLSWRLSANGSLTAIGWGLAILGVASFAAAVGWFLPRARLVAAAARPFALGSDRNWLLGALALGALVRLMWILLVPAVPSSDDAAYVRLAQRLASNLEYEAAGTRAYWPPSYPLELSLPLRVGAPEVR